MVLGDMSAVIHDLKTFNCENQQKNEVVNTADDELKRSVNER